MTKESVIKILQEALDELDLKIKSEEIENLLEVPKFTDMGDFAFPCFSLASKIKMSPQEIAQNLRAEIKKIPSGFQDIQVAGPYINFFFNRKNLSIKLVNEIIKQKDNYGKIKIPKSKKRIQTMIECPSPNTNKPLHIGHLRNMSIGDSVAKISAFSGEKIIWANLNNDRGIHICKSMAAYQKYGKTKTPKSEKIKPDHVGGKYYVMFGKRAEKNKQLEVLAHRLLQKWESGDSSVRTLWKKMNKWAYEGFEKSYKKFNLPKHDITYYESDIYKKGKEIVQKGLKDGIFEKRKDGAVIINLEKEGLDEKVLLRIDGTSVYMTTDLYLATLKYKQYKLNKSYYITGNEQDYHFQVLFKILEKLGFQPEGLKHLSYGMVTLPSGKIKSREGTKGITMDEIIENTQELVQKELIKRFKLSKKELEKRSLVITLAAIKYALLKVDIKKNMIYDPKKSIAMEGDTGPYLLYSYARANSILNKVMKAKKKTKNKCHVLKLNSSETELVQKLSTFKTVLDKSHATLNPSLIAKYSYELSQIFNEFYHNSPVMDSEQQEFRLKLVTAFKHVLKNSLYLIGIDVLEEM